jgi:hypothetical protein
VLAIERDWIVISHLRNQPMSIHRKPFTVGGSQPRSGSDWTEINQLAKRDLLAAVEQLLPGGKLKGPEYVVRNPTRADKRAGSFKICISGQKAGIWSDFATGAKGGDLVSLVAYLKSLPRRDAVRWLRDNIFKKNSRCARAPEPTDTSFQPDAASPESASTDQLPEGETIAVLPPEEAEHPARMFKRMGHRLPDQSWTYRTAEGASCFHVLRWDEPDGSKEIRPLCWVRSAKSEGWAFRAWPESRPLYNLHKITASPDAFIIVCEGEKAADAANKLYAHAYTRGAVATTSSGGAGAAEKTDWTPLAGRTVGIWPDADEVGQKYASDVAKRLEDLGCDITIFDAMELAAKTPAGEARQAPNGWDAADAVAEWENYKALRKAISRTAKPYDPGPAYVSYGPYKMSGEGLKVEGKSSGGVPIRICAPFEVLGESRDPGSNEWGKLLRFRDGDGKLHNRVVPNALLQGEPAILCSLLAGDGLAIHPDLNGRLLSYLAGVQSSGRVRVVARTGWH